MLEPAVQDEDASLAKILMPLEPEMSSLVMEAERENLISISDNEERKDTNLFLLLSSLTENENGSEIPQKSELTPPSGSPKPENTARLRRYRLEQI